MTPAVALDVMSLIGAGSEWRVLGWSGTQKKVKVSPSKKSKKSQLHSKGGPSRINMENK
jgi:hypothetical protein